MIRIADLATRAPSIAARAVIPIAWFGACLVVGCSGHATTMPASPTRGLDVASIDRSVRPGDAFFAYANGRWLATHEIPADLPLYGTDVVASLHAQARTAALIQEAAAAPHPDADAKKVGDYYASLMDEATIDDKGATPLQPALARIAAIQEPAALVRALGASLRADVDVLNATNLDTSNVFGLWIAQDLDDPSRYVPFLLQGGTTLPAREYYLDASDEMKTIRGKYVAHVAAMLELAGLDDAAQRAQRVLALETKIAGVQVPRVDAGDVHKGNNHWARAELARRAPGLDWDALLDAAGLGAQRELVVWHPSAIVGIAALVHDEPLASWRDLLAFHAIEHASPYLAHPINAEAFAFRGTVLAGIPTQRDRWKRAVDDTSHSLGDIVGKLYVARYFPPAEKARAEAMVAQEVAAFARRIDQLAWMSPATKQQAKAKLAALKIGVGYPDTWRDYTGLEIVRGDAFGNAQRVELFHLRSELAKLGRPVDRGEWVMSAQLVDAVNLPAMNAMNFPAGILQPPYFDPARPAVMDYGAIGAVIGHEISHSFDDSGAQFDATGRIRDWWTPADYAQFKAATGKLVTQYAAYRPFPDLALDGQQTLGENIADTAGLAVAYDAYRRSLGGREAPPLQGLAGDQQFFVSFAQMWRSKSREAFARQMILADNHAPAAFRAATVRNLDAWYAAFDVRPGQAMYLTPAARGQVW